MSFHYRCSKKHCRRRRTLRKRLEHYVRTPKCLACGCDSLKHDPAVKRKIERSLAKVVDANQKYRPIFYSLSDEAGLGDLVTAWDFCFDPRTLRAMRRWLKKEYGTLRALNDRVPNGGCKRKGVRTGL